MMITFLATVLLGAVDVQPCEVDGQKAECGRVPVAENRAQPRGRKIDLYFAVVRHEAGRRTDDAIFVLGGGPGQGATALAEFATKRLKTAGRDLVFVDARGTGQSNPLNCDFGGSDEDPQGYLNDFLPIERVRACREVLSRRADLTQYTTRAIVDDLQEVREKLGYRTINLYGSSYGTRVAQEFMRHYPGSVRMAILDGVVAPSSTTPAAFARDAQLSIEGVLALCIADAACRAAYPALLDDYQTMMKRIENGIEVSLTDPKTQKDVRLRVNRGLLGEAFRNFIYSPEVYVRVPYIIHRAAQGHFEEYGTTALNYGRGIRTLSFGMFLSVSCAEDISRIDASAAKQASTGTLLGTYRIEQQIAACQIWPRATPDPARVKPVRSSLPTLLLSGEFDPVTPPKYAAEVARTLSNAVHVIVPKGSHANPSGGCLENITVTAVKSGTVRGLDLSCLQSVPVPKFVVEGE
jgi:pimeloyl-ACP methyl ester carboxylesterase